MTEKSQLPAPGLVPPTIAWKQPGVTRYWMARLLWAARHDSRGCPGGTRVRNALARYLARDAASAVNANRRVKVRGRRLWETLSLMCQEHLLS